MSVIDFPNVSDELKSTTYTSNEGDLGVASLDHSVEIVKLNKDQFLLLTQEPDTVYDRAKLAEFLWVAAIFLDSEQKHYPKLDLVGCDY